MSFRNCVTAARAMLSEGSIGPLGIGRRSGATIRSGVDEHAVSITKDMSLMRDFEKASIN